MQGYTAFGYELNNGTVVYCLIDMVCSLDDLKEFIKNRSVPNNVDCDRLVNTVHNYFTNGIFDTENTYWRILYKVDGSTECSLSTLPGKFIYTP
jgi:hypothetical protein